MIFDIEPKYKKNDEVLIKLEETSLGDLSHIIGFDPDAKKLNCKVVDYCGDRINPDIDIAPDELRFNGSYKIVLLFRNDITLICEEKNLTSLSEIREGKLKDLGI